MTNFIIYNGSDILLFILFVLLVVSILLAILLCFLFLFLIAFKNFFTNLVVIENARPQLTLVIPTGPPITVANDAIEMLPVATDETINDLSKQSKEAMYIAKITKIFAH